MLLRGCAGGLAVGLDRRAQHCLVSTVREHVDLVGLTCDCGGLSDSCAVLERFQSMCEGHVLIALSSGVAIHRVEENAQRDAPNHQPADELERGYHCISRLHVPMPNAWEMAS